MRISYSTPGDAYNRVMVVSPRKRERIFEYIRISNVWSFNTREFFHYRSANVSNLFSKNLLSLSSSIVENPEYKCFLVKKRRTTIQLYSPRNYWKEIEKEEDGKSRVERSKSESSQSLAFPPSSKPMMTTSPNDERMSPRRRRGRRKDYFFLQEMSSWLRWRYSDIETSQIAK